ncbi:transglutaminase domain-containing protein, partial [Winogradskyella sp.]|uniref:transglutaminase domain-containing protein n=1 Tax=Winogradskyella sp. TaxID=1883156 RepID=UPI0025FC7227
MRTLLLVFFLFSIQQTSSQNYESIDSIVSTYPKKFKSIEDFASRIRLDFKTDLDKTRAAYYWIANNITYDYKLSRKEPNSFKIKSKSKSDYEAKFYALKRKYALKVLRKRFAICEGYSQLLTEVLKDLDIISVVVSGFAKRSPNEIGRKRNSSNHAWNAVRIEDKWHLIDVTWSTGNSLYNSEFF